MEVNAPSPPLSGSMFSKNIFRHLREQVIMQKLGHNSSILLPLAINRYDLHSRIEAIPIKIVQINFNYEMTDEALGRGADGFVNPVLEVPGLIWKIWILNQQEKLTAGFIFSRQLGQDWRYDWCLGGESNPHAH